MPISSINGICTDPKWKNQQKFALLIKNNLGAKTYKMIKFEKHLGYKLKIMCKSLKPVIPIKNVEQAFFYTGIQVKHVLKTP